MVNGSIQTIVSSPKCLIAKCLHIIACISIFFKRIRYNGYAVCGTVQLNTDSYRNLCAQRSLATNYLLMLAGKTRTY